MRKKILLISNFVFHYRINIYNYFYSEFAKLDYEFIVIANGAQKVKFDVLFPLIIKKFNSLTYIKFIKKLKPVAVINFIHLKDIIIFPVTYYCKLAGFPVIYWNFGINTKTPDSKLKNLLYYHLHNLSDAILLYSPLEKIFIKEKNHNKLNIAYNTLNLTDIDRSKFTDKNYLKSKYNIKEKHIILFVGRITPNKRLDILLKCFRNKDIAIVVAGQDIQDIHLELINETPNYYYIGEIPYDKKEIGNIFNSCDIFCIPGNIGLAIIEAFFWGKPVVTFEGRNSPEIYYLKDGYNGYKVKSPEDLENKISNLLNDPEKYNKMSQNATKTYEDSAHIKNMFKAFKETIKFVEK
jgi:glycosyltransferase involved in cell wall biosynthesis